MTVGFIGLGRIGTPLARRVLGLGEPLLVWDVRPDAGPDVVAAGATRAAGPGELARQCRLVLLSLPGPAEVVDVVTAREGGLLAHLPPEAWILDLSTVDAETATTMARAAESAGVTYVDCPVSGGVGGAMRGALSVMVGATELEAAPVRPVIETFGSSVFYLDRRGGGAAMKLINNQIALATLALIGQGAAVADRLGIGLEKFYEVAHQSSADSYILRTRVPKLLQTDDRPAFSVELALKDLDLAIRQSRDAGVDPSLGSESRRLYGRTGDLGHAHDDIASVVRAYLDATVDPPTPPGGHP